MYFIFYFVVKVNKYVFEVINLCDVEGDFKYLRDISNLETRNDIQILNIQNTGYLNIFLLATRWFSTFD